MAPFNLFLIILLIKADTEGSNQCQVNPRATETA